MIWKIKTEPKIGATRDVKKFAWYPVIAWHVLEGWDCKVWFETYIQEQMYVKEEDMMEDTYYWVKVKNYIQK